MVEGELTIYIMRPRWVMKVLCGTCRYDFFLNLRKNFEAFLSLNQCIVGEGDTLDLDLAKSFEIYKR